MQRGAKAGLDTGAVATLCLLVCLSALAIDVNMPVIPLLAEGLDAKLKTAQLIISWYLAGYAVGQVPCGLLADRFGRVPVRNAGLLLFAVASLACSLANSIELVLAARFVQGLGGASGPVVARASIRDLSSGRHMAQLMSVTVTVLSVATLAGPIAGSILGVFLGWRSTFFTGVVIGALALAMSRAWLPETLPRDLPRVTPWQQFAGNCGAFFRQYQCVWATLLVSAAFSGFMTILASIAAIITDVYRYPPIYIGPIFALAVIAYLAAAMLNRKWLHQRTPMEILKPAMAAFGLAAALAADISFLGHAHIALFIAVLMLYTAGIGIILPNASALALEPVPKLAGFGASILGTVQIASAALVSYLAASFYSESVVSLTATMAITASVTLAVYVAGGRRVIEES